MVTPDLLCPSQTPIYSPKFGQSPTDRAQLPLPSGVNGWNSQQYVDALQHDENCKEYNPNLRQLLHVSFKIAAKMGNRFLDALKSNEEIIARGVTANLFERHIRPVFL
jgi:tagaturonate epimerase